jgi:hypothetical protein
MEPDLHAQQRRTPKLARFEKYFQKQFDKGQATIAIRPVHLDSQDEPNTWTFAVTYVHEWRTRGAKYAEQIHACGSITQLASTTGDPTHAFYTSYHFCWLRNPTMNIAPTWNSYAYFMPSHDYVPGNLTVRQVALICAIVAATGGF